MENTTNNTPNNGNPEENKPAQANPSSASPAMEKQLRGLKITIGVMAVIIVLLLLFCLLSKKETTAGHSNASGGATNQETPAGGKPVGGDSTAESEEASGQTGETEESGPEESKVPESSEPASDPSESSQASESSQSSEESKTEEPEASSDYVLTVSVGNTWESDGLAMCTADMSLGNFSTQGLSGWTLVLTIPGLSDIEGWNGNYSASGNTLTITNAEYNGDLAAGGTIYIGCNIGTSGSLKIASATLNGKPCQVKFGGVSQNDPKDDPKEDPKDDPKDDPVVIKRPKDAVQGDDWLHTDGHRILDKDGKEVWLTGVNWFGYNTGTNTFDGLWTSKLEPTVKAIADHGFNLIRVPFSAQLINQWAAGDYPRANFNQAYNPALTSMNSLEIFEYFLSLAETNGIKVMIDIHCAETNASGHMVNLWYSGSVTTEDYYKALEWMANRYKDNDTIIAYDLKNEPHGKPGEGDGAAIWNDSKKPNNWKYVAETAAAKVLAKNPNVLILVEGTEIYPKNNRGDYSSGNDSDYYFNWWGGNLRAVKDYPIDLGQYQDKLVYSPHDYGPTVYEQPWFKGSYTYDSLMKDCWHDNWFYIYEENTAPLLIGEWGGFMREPNLTWMTYMRQLISTYHLNHTFWCLNANSGDTGGLLLDDFTTWDTQKYDFVKEVLWQENGKFVGLDHAIPLGENGITLDKATGLQ